MRNQRLAAGPGSASNFSTTCSWSPYLICSRGNSGISPSSTWRVSRWPATMTTASEGAIRLREQEREDRQEAGAQDGQHPANDGQEYQRHFGSVVVTN